ncbi:hypothetical protein ACFOY4_01445 [Actinomadura syzygii]|uniref:Uncharacterized protein n=1 Tax=Actinomadura syzygii TaxID=1427538 RepID=A0A5D0TR28_9ACTN|nr:hypothetical protein [Actinomadura syzygii]TYC08588.1 hypothetical protein FXF65_37480 [Actinomadura syzygii]
MPQSHSEPGVAAEPRPALSPYDTGVRCEPKSWLPYGTAVTERTPVENFGKVDFEDEEGNTVCVAYVERGRDGRYTVHVEPLGDADAIAVELHAE